MIALFHGAAQEVLLRLDAQSFDAIVTDPPYASGGFSLAEKQKGTKDKYTDSKGGTPHLFPDFEGDQMDQRCWIYHMAHILSLCRAATKPGGVIVTFCDWRQLPATTDALQIAGWLWRGVAVWDKVSSRPQRGRYKQQAEFIVWGSRGRLPLDRGVPPLPGVYRYGNVQGAERLHQTQKSLPLMRDLLAIVPPGSRVLDPFCGSGSTLAAAAELGLDSVGIEASLPIAQAAAKRLNTRLISTGL